VPHRVLELGSPKLYEIYLRGYKRKVANLGTLKNKVPNLPTCL
jgi:hypothetical protein